MITVDEPFFLLIATIAAVYGGLQMREAIAQRPHASDLKAKTRGRAWHITVAVWNWTIALIAVVFALGWS